MFWLHHPQRVRPRKAVAELSVARFSAAPLDTSVIVVGVRQNPLPSPEPTSPDIPAPAR